MKQTKQKCDKTKCDNPAGLFIPAGIFIGMGVGFIINELVGGLFLGLGAGFLLMAITGFKKKLC
ncbi:hypothetical protein KY334_05905 [Candidatus Woesearchaeota archaeon]|nr:hypothetical protein [Candidatus Woesearchaeota archaeon]